MCAGLAVLPGWVVSTNLMLRTIPTTHRGPLALDARVLRVGRNAVVTQVEIRDTGDAGRADRATASSPPRCWYPTADRPTSRGRWCSTHPDARPGAAAAGLLRDPSGRRHRRSRSRSTTGCATPGGSCTAGRLRCSSTPRPPTRSAPAPPTADVVLHFLRPGRVGSGGRPRLGARTIDADGHLVRVEVVDAGADDRVMAVAVAPCAHRERAGTVPRREQPRTPRPRAYRVAQDAGLDRREGLRPPVGRHRRSRIVEGEPTIIAANHSQRPRRPDRARRPSCPGFPRFLAASYLWKIPPARFLFWLAEVVADLPPPGRLRHAPTTTSTFEACHDALADGAHLMIFPEGEVHREPAMLPLKTGAARIGLGAPRTAGRARHHDRAGRPRLRRQGPIPLAGRDPRRQADLVDDWVERYRVDETDDGPRRHRRSHRAPPRGDAQPRVLERGDGHRPGGGHHDPRRPGARARESRCSPNAARSHRALSARSTLNGGESGEAFQRLADRGRGLPPRPCPARGRRSARGSAGCTRAGSDSASPGSPSAASSSCRSRRSAWRSTGRSSRRSKLVGGSCSTRRGRRPRRASPGSCSSR